MRHKCNILFVIIASFMVTATTAQDSLNITKITQWKTPTPSVYNEIWGIAQNGREYAVIGTWSGTYFLDVTDPNNVVMVDYVAGVDEACFCTHRDYHDYAGYLYMVTDENPGSLQIVDLSYLPDSVSVVYDSDALFKRSHNVFVDSSSALMYSAGGDPDNNGLRVFSLADPENPVEVKNFQTPGGYIHDVYVRNDTVYAHGGNNGMYVYDFANVSSPVLIGSLTFYPHQGYNHSGWLNKQGNTYVFADETQNKDVKIADVSDLTDILILDTVNAGGDLGSLPHNPLILGDFAYVSYYLDGLWIYNISDPGNTTVAGYYNPYTGVGDTLTGGGAWGVYPFLPSGNVLVSDMRSGLFIFDASAAVIKIGATITATEATLTMCDATATVNATGGVAPYTYVWDSGANGQTSQVATGLCVGTFSVIVSDSLGNQVTVSVTVDEAVGISEYAGNPFSISVFPNPVHDQLVLRFEELVEIHAIRIVDMRGRVAASSEEAFFGNSIEYPVGDLKPGNYLIYIGSDKGNFVAKMTKATTSND
ncbi:MAG: choice-of-anchor B family protein [Flavobacteriales bacterium]|nr:choice-of-anchor B family protein [Flavobacteriales bacterium]